MTTDAGDDRLVPDLLAALHGLTDPGLAALMTVMRRWSIDEQTVDECPDVALFHARVWALLGREQRRREAEIRELERTLERSISTSPWTRGDTSGPPDRIAILDEDMLKNLLDDEPAASPPAMDVNEPPPDEA